MIIDNKAWFTVFDEEFDSDKYLYHYTEFSKAFKILDGNCLKFSKINRTNDTLESKLKICFDKTNDNGFDYFQLSNLVQLFHEICSYNLQLLCFSMDKKCKNNNVDELTKYSDYSGRGFAMPRMWAQYSNNL